MTYRLSNGKREKTARLLVNVHDTKAPDIQLKTDSITVLQGTKIKPKEYLIYAEDAVDGDMTDKVIIDEKNDQIIYRAKDSSGNQSEKVLKIKYIQKKETPPKTETIIVEKPQTQGSESSKEQENNGSSNSGSNKIEPPVNNTESSLEDKDFPFEEGETFTDAYNRCMLYAESVNANSVCEPYDDADGNHAGYRIHFK